MRKDSKLGPDSLRVGALYRLKLRPGLDYDSWSTPTGTKACDTDDFVMLVAARWQEDYDTTLGEGKMNPHAWLEIKFLCASSQQAEKVETILLRLHEWEQCWTRVL